MALHVDFVDKFELEYRKAIEEMLDDRIIVNDQVVH